MAFCPHCDHFYDEDNETQPCCGACGHPITCGCSGHSHSWRSSRKPFGPPTPDPARAVDRWLQEIDADWDDPDEDNASTDDASDDGSPNDEEPFEPDDLPF